MPQVPYTGVPTVAPENRPTPRYSADTPAAAFGGAVAQAETTLGKDLEGTGNELFARATAMQDLYNHSKATEADAQLMERAADLHEKLRSMDGKEAVDYFNTGFKNDLHAAREEIRNSLPNDMARKMYDQSTLTTISRTLFNAAGEAGHQNDLYAKGAAAARVQATSRGALIDPHDDERFDASVEQLKTDVAFQHRQDSPELQKEAISQAVGKLWYDRILRIASEGQPGRAHDLLQKAIKDGSLEGDSERIGRLTSIVQSSLRQVGARQISSQVRSGADLSYGANIVPIPMAKTVIGEMESSNRYYIHPDSGTVHGEALGKYGIMEDNLQSWLAQAGMPSMTKKEFLASPKAQDQLFEFKFGQLMQAHKSFNGAAGDWIGHGPRGDKFGTTDTKYIAKANALLAQNAPVQDQVAKARAAAEKMAPDDPLLPDAAERRVVDDVGLQKRLEVQQDYQNKSVIDDAIMKGFNGKPAANIDELFQASPEAESAYLQSPPPKQLEYQRSVAAYYNAATKLTQRGMADKLLGMAHGDNEDVEKFINTNIYQQPLSQTDMDKFAKLQRQLVKDRGGNVEIRQALKLAEPLLNAEGLDLKDKELMAKFRGSYIDAVQDWHANNPNKPLDEKTAKQMAAGLLQKQTSENFWYGKDNLFNLPLPNSLADEIRSKQPKITAPELEIYRQEYVRQQFNALQKTKTKEGK